MATAFRILWIFHTLDFRLLFAVAEIHERFTEGEIVVVFFFLVFPAEILLIFSDMFSGNLSVNRCNDISHSASPSPDQCLID